MEAAHLVNDLRIVALVARYRCIVQVETQASMEWMYERIWGEGEIQNYAQPKYNVFFRFEYWYRENRSNWAIIFRCFFYSFIRTFLFPFFSSFIIVFCNLSLSLFRRLRIFDVFFSFVFFRSFGFFEPFGFMRFVGFFFVFLDCGLSVIFHCVSPAIDCKVHNFHPCTWMHNAKSWSNWSELNFKICITVEWYEEFRYFGTYIYFIFHFKHTSIDWNPSNVYYVVKFEWKITNIRANELKMQHVRNSPSVHPVQTGKIWFHLILVLFKEEHHIAVTRT